MRLKLSVPKLIKIGYAHGMDRVELRMIVVNAFAKGYLSMVERADYMASIENLFNPLTQEDLDSCLLIS